jgi:cytochrome d ubiquinol oxidase subunit II
VTFEFREKRESASWRRGWDRALVLGSTVTPLLIGVTLSNLVGGLPIDAQQEYVGTFWDLLTPYTITGGLTFVLLCLLHGATFLALKTHAEVRERAVLAARRVGAVTALAVVVYVVWTHIQAGEGVLLSLVELIAIMAVLAALWLVREGRDGWAFVATSVTIASVVGALFAGLYPRVMVSSLDSSYDLTVSNTASAPYALKVMTIVAVVFLPVVLVYQGWSYHVFRKRVSREDVGVA